MTATSPASASPAPPPIAAPLMAVTTGFVMREKMPMQLHGQLGALLDQVLLVGRQVLELGQIGAGAEGRAGAGQHEAAHAVVALRPRAEPRSAPAVSAWLRALRFSGRFMVRMRTAAAILDQQFGHRVSS